MEWFFDGLGTFLIGLFFGGTGGFVIGRLTIKKSIRQTQKAKDYVNQTQTAL